MPNEEKNALDVMSKLPRKMLVYGLSAFVVLVAMTFWFPTVRIASLLVAPITYYGHKSINEDIHVIKFEKKHFHFSNGEKKRENFYHFCLTAMIALPIGVIVLFLPAGIIKKLTGPDIIEELNEQETKRYAHKGKNVKNLLFLLIVAVIMLLWFQCVTTKLSGVIEAKFFPRLESCR